MIQLKATRSWIYIKHLNGDIPVFPCRVKEVKKDVYKIPNTPFHINFMLGKNEVQDKEDTYKEWRDDFAKYDNRNLKQIMEHLKTNEGTVVDKIIQNHKDKDIFLWPFLYKHQVICTHLGLMNNGYGLFLEMGSGKSVVSLQIATARLKKGNTDAVLIVSPANIMRPVWETQINTIKQWTNEPSLTCEILDGTKDERIMQLLNSKANFFVINYEMLEKMEPYLINKGFNMIIFDESTRIKNIKAHSTRTALELSRRTRYKLILSGTPIANKELDIHCQVNTLQYSSNYNPLYLNYYAFRNHYFMKLNNRPFAPLILKKDKREELTNSIYAQAIRYSKKECIDLPPVITQIVPCQMTKEQITSYLDLKEKIITEIRGHEIKAQFAITKILRLAQITSGFSNDIHGNAVRFSIQPKLDTVCDLVEDIPSKVIIFCRFKETIKALKERLGNQALTYFGEVSKKDKNNNLLKFENEDYKVLIAQTQSGGIGLNLQFASYIIFCELDWSSMNYEQAVSRIHRDGQKADKCTVYVCMCPKTIDEHLYEVIKEKKNTADKALKTVMRSLVNKDNDKKLKGVR